MYVETVDWYNTVIMNYSSRPIFEASLVSANLLWICMWHKMWTNSRMTVTHFSDTY